jgi:hypothetical protein
LTQGLRLTPAQDHDPGSGASGATAGVFLVAELCPSSPSPPTSLWSGSRGPRNRQLLKHSQLYAQRSVPSTPRRRIKMQPRSATTHRDFDHFTSAFVPPMAIVTENLEADVGPRGLCSLAIPLRVRVSHRLAASWRRALDTPELRETKADLILCERRLVWMNGPGAYTGQSGKGGQKSRPLLR